ncbi:TniB family NTP-binding protein [Streptomyces sp. S465]|uniref:TniB family NTP-binding protein n=1 Tax=Streptomyces sp. S465 TaxID=2979468 RepID=UPI0022A8745C|nr:TniB family NTP-binding protein [Streptomyces sp. S465]WAP60650.1 TniB family NTP-binding protein [Streptomyces sp. S465]
MPVAYVLVPPGATAKSLTAEFARYLGIPTTTRMTQAQITEAVCHTYNTAGIQLVLIDEIHRLNPRTTTGAQAADLLKDLTERIHATCVYAGIDVTGHTLFSGACADAHPPARANPPSTAAPPRPATANRHPFTDVITDLEKTPSIASTTALGTLPPPTTPTSTAHRRRPASVASPPHPPSRHHRICDGYRTHHQEDIWKAIQLDHLAEEKSKGPAPPAVRTGMMRT